MMARLWLFFLFLGFQAFVFAKEKDSIQIKHVNEHQILDQFLRMNFADEGYGYALDGTKPISIRDYYPLDQFPISKDFQYSEKEFINSLLVQQAIPIWEKRLSDQKRFILKTVALPEPKSNFSGLEVQFINTSKLKTVIDDNINLFRYVLSPNTTADQLVNQISCSQKPFSEILHNDCVLIGIVLGFGAHNSLVGGRLEEIFALSISNDYAPFTPKSHLMTSKKEHSLKFLTPERYGAYYLGFAGGDDSFFKTAFSPLLPSRGFSNIEDELLALDSLNEPLPDDLLKQRPAFIFGAYKGGSSNQPLFKKLLEVQKKSQALLKRTDFLEQVLEKIEGKKPVISCAKPPSSDKQQTVFQNMDTKEWIHILQGALDRFDTKEDRSAFCKAFCHPSTSSQEAPKMMGASYAVLEGLRKAQQNLSAANAYFEKLSKDSSLKKIVAKQLYSKTTSSGSGEVLKGADRVRVGYVIEDSEGNVLFANCDSWLKRSQLIPCFAQGIKGMKVGEKRTLFVHPALGYGALTTLPPCKELIIKVHLLDIDDQSSGTFASLEALDLSWVQDLSFFSLFEESVRQLPPFRGSFYRKMLNKIEGLDIEAVIQALDTNDSKPISEDKSSSIGI